MAIRTAVIGICCALGFVADAAPWRALRPRAVLSARDATAVLGRRKLAFDAHIAGSDSVGVAFFDVDGTWRVTAQGRPPEDVEFLPGVVPRLRALDQEGKVIVALSNQAGVGKHISIERADAGLAKTVAMLAAQGIRVAYYDLAEHYDADRKPGIGMAERFERLLQVGYGLRIDKAASFMVGDAGYKRLDRHGPADIRPDGREGTDFGNSDRLFAQGFGIRFEHAADYFGRSTALSE